MCDVDDKKIDNNHELLISLFKEDITIYFYYVGKVSRANGVIRHLSSLSQMINDKKK